MKIRLQRFLADCGVASRRECEEMILAGRVRVNGDLRLQMPVLVDPENDIIAVDGQTLEPGERLKEEPKVYYLLNKPKGILVTNYDPSERKTVGELMEGVKERVFPVGRLDMDARGALIMTNDGELANRLTHPRFGVEKTFIVEVDGTLTHGDLEKIKHGIWLGPKHRGGGGGGKTERFAVKVVGRERGRTIVEVKLTEGKNREVRRVMARLGHPVRDLNRVAIGDKLTIKGLKVGEYRPLSEREVAQLFEISSPEYQQKQRAETQAWYEAKEMEKERKRLLREKAEGPPEEEKPAREEKRFRREPKHKGRKPFVPPTGRNAGKALGGNAIGRKRFEEEQRREERTSHPLGEQAQPDDFE